MTKKPKYDSLDGIALSLINRISQFSRECERAEYTDTGEVWTLLNSIEDDLRAGRRKAKTAERERDILLMLLEEEIHARNAGDYGDLTPTQNDWTDEAERAVAKIKGDD